jgi:ubiquitin carboxyl-terminal hydrolase 7
MPTEAEAKTGSKSIALALQRVFYNMQFSKNSVTTKQLTTSFGWDSVDAFSQHDVQEFSRVLCDSLEENMKGTIVDGTMQRLFEGKSQMYIQCVNVPYKSERTETFLDLALNVKVLYDRMMMPRIIS